MRKTLKKKVSERRGAIHMRSRTIRKIVEGGHNAPPPPGLIRVNDSSYKDLFENFP